MTPSCTVLTTSDGYWPGPNLYECSWDVSKHAFELFACNCMLVSYQRVPFSVTAIKLDISRSIHDMNKYMQRMTNDIYLSKTHVWFKKISSLLHFQIQPGRAHTIRGFKWNAYNGAAYNFAWRVIAMRRPHRLEETNEFLTSPLFWNIWGLRCRRQVSMTSINNYVLL